MKIEYHPAIENEIRKVKNYYNKCSEGLGDDFVNEFERQILKIASMPTRWEIIKDGIRRSLIKRFPYVIYFRVLNSNLLHVTVVKHQRRHPAYGKKRK